MKKNCTEILMKAVNKSDRWKITIASQWTELIGETLTGQIVLQGFHDNSILLVVKNACLAQELSMQKKSLMKKFNDFLGEPKITEIKLKIGRGVLKSKYF